MKVAWKRVIAGLYVTGMLLSYGHIYREADNRIIHRCVNPGTKAEACYDTLYYDSPAFVAWFSSIWWPYHWSEVAWRTK